MVGEVFHAGGHRQIVRDEDLGTVYRSRPRPIAAQTINVAHITVRESISLLLLKLFVLEVIAAVLLVVFHPFLFSAQFLTISPYFDLFALRFFLLAVVVKLFISIYLILLWVNDYYDISTKLVVHKRGIIFVRKEQLALDDIQSITMDQGLIGKIMNFGTVSLYDWKWRKYEYLYGIHNPLKYVKIIESLLPGIDEERKVIRESLMEDEDN